MRNIIATLATIAIALVAPLAMAQSTSVTFPIGAAPGNSVPVVYLVHKDISPDGINTIAARTGLYGFSGEIIHIRSVARDNNGAADLSPTAQLLVSGAPKVLCAEVLYGSLSAPDKAQVDASIPSGFKAATDKIYDCYYTIEPQITQHGSKEVKVKVTDTSLAFGTIMDPWFLNPDITLSLSTTDTLPLSFAVGGAGDTVFSNNGLKAVNSAEGGAAVWAFLAGSDLTDPNAASKCPTTNALDIHAMSYRTTSGTRNHGYSVMPEYSALGTCDLAACKADTANGIPVTSTDPGFGAAGDRMLGNGQDVEIFFKLLYPVPCIGSFTGGTLRLMAEAV